MRTSLLLLALAGLVAAASAAAAPPLPAPAPLTALAANGGRVASASAWTHSSCERAFLSVPSKPSPAEFPTGPCPEVSTGRGIASIAVAGDRVLWLAYAGGNIREWTLWTATPTRPKPRLLRFLPRDVEAPAPLVLGSAGSVLPYAVGTRVVALRSDGSRAFAWTAPAPVVALAARASQVAVAQQGGRVTIVAAGKIVRDERFGSEVSAVAFSGDRLIVQEGRALELRGAGAQRTWPLPAKAVLQDADATRAAYVARGRVHLLRLADGLDRAAATGTLAQLDAGRLIVASGRRLQSLSLPAAPGR